MKHTWYSCASDAHEDDTYYHSCQFCDGGLSHCTICGGFEGTLTADCCGHKLDEHVLNAVYKGGLNFKDDKWTVESKQ